MGVGDISTVWHSENKADQVGWATKDCGVVSVLYHNLPCSAAGIRLGAEGCVHARMHGLQGWDVTGKRSRTQGTPPTPRHQARATMIQQGGATLEGHVCVFRILAGQPQRGPKKA